MAQIVEDYVSFDLAKLLKKKGFDEICQRIYDNDCPNEILGSDGLEFKNSELIEFITAPTLSLACKWLREVYGLHISLEPCYDCDSMHVVFLAFVQNVADVHEFMDGRKNVASHPNVEKSYELAIKYCLENLI